MMEPERSLFESALEVAMAGLRAATERAEVAYGAALADGDHRELERAVIETMWWQKSVEDLWEEESGEAFYRGRDASAGGLAVGGLAYARNVGGHRVDRTYDEVVYRAASTVESIVIASFGDGLSTGDEREIRWPPLVDLPPLPMEDPFGRAEMYTGQVAGRPVLEPLRAGLEFFEGLL